jgi:hypothetical protein
MKGLKEPWGFSGDFLEISELIELFVRDRGIEHLNLFCDGIADLRVIALSLGCTCGY